MESARPGPNEYTFNDRSRKPLLQRERLAPMFCFRLVATATKPMNVLSILQRKEQKQQALELAQKQSLQPAQLCYRGVCYQTVKVQSR